jgi:hypothetical protein
VALDLSELTFTSEELENGFSILSLSPNIESITLCNCVGFQSLLLDNLTLSLFPALVKLLRMDSLQELVGHVQSGNFDQAWAALYHELDRIDVTRMDTFRARLQQGAIIVADTARHVSGVNALPTSLLISGYSNLRVLNVSGYDSDILPTGGLALFSVFSGGSLVEVDISQSESVSFADISILASVCAHSLSVFKAARTVIDDYALIALGTQCHNLTVLDVSECFFITDESLRYAPLTGNTVKTFGALKWQLKKTF